MNMGENLCGNLVELVTKRERRDKGYTGISGLCLCRALVNFVGLMKKRRPF